MVGLGSIGRRHARNLRRLGVTRLSAYRTGRGTLPVDADLGDIPLFATLDEALATKPDIVFVTNPSSLHLHIARAAVASRSHLFIEKPIAASIDGVYDVVTAAESAGLHVAVGYDMRFNPALQALKGALSGDALGRVVSAQIEVGSYLPDWHAWEDYRASYAARADLGGGVMLTLSHELDLARWLLGDVDSVSAEIGKLSALEMDVEDVAALLLRFRSGAVATVTLDYIQRPSHRRCRVVCEHGSVEWSEATGQTEVRTVDGRVVVGRDPADGNAAFVEEVREFLHLVETGKASGTLATGRDGERAVAIIDAARESARTGRRVAVGEPVTQRIH
jgi:predicted dehydrogenase